MRILRALIFSLIVYSHCLGNSAIDSSLSKIIECYKTNENCGTIQNQFIPRDSIVKVLGNPKYFVKALQQKEISTNCMNSKYSNCATKAYNDSSIYRIEEEIEMKYAKYPEKNILIYSQENLPNNCSKQHRYLIFIFDKNWNPIGSGIIRETEDALCSCCDANEDNEFKANEIFKKRKLIGER
jgi:hypothetical protein